MKIKDLTDVATAVTALYGALLSTYIFWKDSRKDSRDIRVSLSMGFLTRGPHISEPQLIIQAANVGHRPVTLVGYSIRLPSGEQIVSPAIPTTPPLPCDLADGKNCTGYLGAEDIAKTLFQNGYKEDVIIYGEFRDATDHFFRSKKIKFSVHQWIKDN